MSVRTEDDAEGGNAFTAMLVPLPTHVEDPADRLRYVVEATAARKPASPGSDGTSPARTGLEIVDALPSSLFSVVGRLAASGTLTAMPPMANLIVSNVKGPSEALYLAGARITHLHGRTMAGPGLGMMIHCCGYAGQLDFGVTALRDLVGDPEIVTAGIVDEIERLRTATTVG